MSQSLERRDLIRKAFKSYTSTTSGNLLVPTNSLPVTTSNEVIQGLLGESDTNKASLSNEMQMRFESKSVQPIQRRTALQLGAVFILATRLGSTQEAHAQFSTLPFTSRPEWFPLDPTEGPTLYAPNGPLDEFDQTYGTRVRKYFADYAKWALSESDEVKENPTLKKFWGFCAPAAVTNDVIAVQRGLGLPEAKATTIYKGPVAKFGVLTAYHAGFAHFRPDLYDIKVNIDYFIKGLKQGGQAFIGNLGPGNEPWFYNVHAVSDDEQELIITGLGRNSTPVSRSLLKFAYIAESLEDAITHGRTEYIQGENKIFRHPELTKERVYEFAGLV